MHKFSFLLVLICTFFSINISAQSLRINEVSQGTTGSQEYVELLVIGPVLTDCASVPQCLDLRGWILDDNNGYFSGGPSSGTGIANGAIRFSNMPFWSCLNPGTIILIYNDNDMNAQIPTIDQDVNDGNCKLILPISSGLFEKSTTLPSNVNMTYPIAGWTSGGDWSTIGMANGDDSFQIYAPSNTTVPVHGVSWGNNSVNNIIYFAGAAGGKVFSATNTTSTDLSTQSNWISASAASGQTPGIANSTQNAVLIGGMNLNCSAPLVVTVNPANESCVGSCNGSATVQIEGGQTPYQTPVWSNGVTASQLSGLCPGNYSVAITDANGCSTTANFTISSDAGLTVGTSGNVSICAGESTVISANGANTYNWNNNLGAGSSFTVSPATTTTYIVTGTAAACTATATLTVTVNPNPVVNAGADQFVCGNASVTLTATGATTFVWSNGVVNGVAFQPAAGVTTYTVTGSSANCSATDEVIITNSGTLSVDAGQDLTICSGDTISLTATGANQFIWNNGVTNGVAFVPTNTVNTYTVVGSSGTCTGTDDVTVTVVTCDWSLEMPNVFTPNKDLVNDFFIPIKQQNVVVKKFQIFNRWGNIVHESDAQVISWDGKAGGDEAADGTYFYTLEFVDGQQNVQKLQGFLHLIRK